MQKINLQNITPEPLQALLAKPKEQETASQIWKQLLCFEKGKYYQIQAPSGKGKSTFVHILYGIRNDFSGKLALDGQDSQQINATEWAQIRQNQISIVFQDLRLFLDLTAWENIEVKLALNSSDKSQKALEMLKSLGVERLLDKKTGLLSYGERQRIAIVRALLQPFDFLLLDEPFSHLDEDNIRKAAQLIRETCQLHQAGMITTSLGYEYGITWDEKRML